MNSRKLNRKNFSISHTSHGWTEYFFIFPMLLNVFRSAVCREESITTQSTEKGQLSHGSQPFKSSLITVNEAHAPHNTFADVTPAWCYHRIWLRDRELDSFIGVVYLFSQSMPNVDDGMIHLKWMMTVGEAKRLDENPILPHNRRRQVWIRLTLTQCDVVTKPKRLNVKQWLLLRCFVEKFKAQIH